MNTNFLHYNSLNIYIFKQKRLNKVLSYRNCFLLFHSNEVWSSSKIDISSPIAWFAGIKTCAVKLLIFMTIVNWLGNQNVKFIFYIALIHHYTVSDGSSKWHEQKSMIFFFNFFFKGMVMTLFSLGFKEQKRVFRANHPFIYFIYDTENECSAFAGSFKQSESIPNQISRFHSISRRFKRFLHLDFLKTSNQSH